jgi:hypothetical protein
MHPETFRTYSEASIDLLDYFPDASRDLRNASRDLRNASRDLRNASRDVPEVLRGIARSPRLPPECIPRPPECIPRRSGRTPRHRSISSTTSGMHPDTSGMHPEAFRTYPEASIDLLDYLRNASRGIPDLLRGIDRSPRLRPECIPTHPECIPMHRSTSSTASRDASRGIDRSPRLPTSTHSRASPDASGHSSDAFQPLGTSWIGVVPGVPARDRRARDRDING